MLGAPAGLFKFGLKDTPCLADSVMMVTFRSVIGYLCFFAARLKSLCGYQLTTSYHIIGLLHKNFTSEKSSSERL